jgi:hypothetical protein
VGIGDAGGVDEEGASRDEELECAQHGAARIR